MPNRSRVAVLLAVVLLTTVAIARADQSYDVSGEDVYTLGPSVPATHIAYDGTQHLTVQKDDGGTRFVAEATYTRRDEDGKAVVHARFVQRMTKSGDFDDLVDSDPDFLTILNQPFAIELDATTMRDLDHLHKKVPFEATSPLGGAHLRGTLQPVPAGKIRGVPATGVRFSAEGPMTGSLPQHPTDNLHGTIQMFGTAYYSLKGALLVALDATLTIQGTLSAENNTAIPVKIVYHRTIRAGDGSVEQAKR